MYNSYEDPDLLLLLRWKRVMRRRRKGWRSISITKSNPLCKHEPTNCSEICCENHLKKTDSKSWNMKKHNYDFNHEKCFGSNYEKYFHNKFYVTDYYLLLLVDKKIILVMKFRLKLIIIYHLEFIVKLL